MRKKYKSIAQLSTGFTVSEDIKLSNDIFNTSQIDVNFSNAIENITSPKVLSLLSYNLILHDLKNPPFRTQKESKIKKNPELDINSLNKKQLISEFEKKKAEMRLLNPASPEEKKLIDLLETYEYDVESLRDNLTVGRYQRTDYINMSFSSENPDLSAYAINALCNEFQSYYESFRHERSYESIASIDSLVKKKKEELNQRISFKTQYLSDSSVLNPNMESNNLIQISQYENSLAEEKGNSQNLEYQIQQLDRQISALQSGNQVIRKNSTSDNNDEYMILRKQYNDLYSDYIKKGSNDPETRKKLDDLQAKMQAKIPAFNNPKQEVDNSAGTAAALDNLIQKKITAEGELKSTNVKIGFYQRSLAILKGGMGSQASKSANVQQIDKEIEIANAEYSDAKDKLNMATNMNGGMSNSFKQTMFGQPAYKAEPSGRLAILSLSGLSALILSCAVFIFIQFFDQSIQTPSQFQRLTGLKLLGVINWIPLKGMKLSEQVVQTELDDEPHNRTNSFRELLRKLRFEVENSGKRIFLFTSTEAQQGKTTLIQALAFSLSLGKKKVLILDTNFCNNDITALNDATPSLEKFSGHGKSLDIKEIDPLISKTDVKGVDIIGCKGGDYTPTEILPQNHLLNYLPELLTKYDYIFMEGAPLNGFTDTKELVSYAEAVIAIFSAHAEVRQVDTESISFLKGLNGKFLGGILNKVEAPNIKF